MLKILTSTKICFYLSDCNNILQFNVEWKSTFIQLVLWLQQYVFYQILEILECLNKVLFSIKIQLKRLICIKNNMKVQFGLIPYLKHVRTYRLILPRAGKNNTNFRKTIVKILIFVLIKIWSYHSHKNKLNFKYANFH